MLKKRKLTPSRMFIGIDLKHIVNINDIWFINEQTLKNPEGS